MYFVSIVLLFIIMLRFSLHKSLIKFLIIRFFNHPFGEELIILLKKHGIQGVNYIIHRSYVLKPIVKASQF